MCVHVREITDVFKMLTGSRDDVFCPLPPHLPHLASYNLWILLRSLMGEGTCCQRKGPFLLVPLLHWVILERLKRKNWKDLDSHLILGPLPSTRFNALWVMKWLPGSWDQRRRMQVGSRPHWGRGALVAVCVQGTAADWQLEMQVWGGDGNLGELWVA